MLSAIAAAIVDVCEENFDGSIFRFQDHQFWNPRISFRNHYVNSSRTMGRRKIWKFNYPRIFASAWHLFRFIMILLMILALSIFEPVTMLTAPVIACVFGLLWHFTYHQFKERWLLE
jgi:putative flippase GtrA